jgi:hypothetical protein
MEQSARGSDTLQQSRPRAATKARKPSQVESARPTSEHVALVTYLKSTGKRALALFYYIPAKQSLVGILCSPQTRTCSGWKASAKAKARIEAQNFEHNFRA